MSFPIVIRTLDALKSSSHTTLPTIKKIEVTKDIIFKGLNCNTIEAQKY